MKILVADDEKLIRWFLGRTLGKGGHEVITAENVQDASVKLSSEEIDVLITDLRMPGENGTALIGKLDKRGKKPRAIVCSAFVTAELEEELRQKGVCTLKKPIALDELNEAIQICIEKEPSSSTTNFSTIFSDIYKASLQKRGRNLGKEGPKSNSQWNCC